MIRSQDLCRASPTTSLFTAKDASTPKDRRSALLSCTTNISPRCTLSSSTWTFSARPSSKSWSRSTKRANFPHVLVLDARGGALYNQAGEVDSQHIEDIFKKSLS